MRFALCLVETSLKWSLQLSDGGGKRGGEKRQRLLPHKVEENRSHHQRSMGEWEGIRPELEPHSAVSPSDLQESTASIQASLCVCGGGQECVRGV